MPLCTFDAGTLLSLFERQGAKQHANYEGGGGGLGGLTPPIKSWPSSKGVNTTVRGVQYNPGKKIFPPPIVYVYFPTGG